MAHETDGMIALLPSREDAARLAVEGGEDASQLHVTLVYMPDVTQMSEPQRDRVVEAARRIAQSYEPFTARGFNVSAFNPDGDDPCVVLGLSGRFLDYLHRDISSDLNSKFPATHLPWIPHITLNYTDDLDLAAYADRVGDVRFDRVRVAFGNEYLDIPMNPWGMSVTAAVNSTSWKSLPIAPRETRFSADDAVARILSWAGGSAKKFNSAFLWRNSEGDPGSRNNYRLPVGDIINGKLTVVPRAIFSAAVILSGGHGGLEGVVGEDERDDLKAVVTEIYEVLQAEYNDPRTVPPWLLGKTEEERDQTKEDLGVTSSIDWEDPFGAGVWTVTGLTASVNSSGWAGMPLADQDHAWDGEAARKRVWDWAEGNFRTYRRAFLWYDAERPEQKNSYKLPIADVIDGELRIVPRAVNAVAAVLGGARGGVDIPDDDMDSVQRIVNRIQARWSDNESETAGIMKNFVQAGHEYGEAHEDGDCGEGYHKMPDGSCMSDEEMESLEAAAAPVYPHSSDFEWDGTNDMMPFTVTADGRARGLLWMWNKCHAGIVDECVMAPRSATNYAYFHNGQVLTSDGKLVKVGKITMGTGHAGPNMRWIPAADHYDNTGTGAAIGRVTETPRGGFFNGVLVSSLTDEQVQELRRSPISGDWRRINGNLELVAALAVNTPGFPIVASINGEPQSLVAAGMIVGDDDVKDEKLTKQEKDLTAMIDDLDSKITEMAARGRTRKWGRLMAALDDRRK